MTPKSLSNAHRPLAIAALSLLASGCVGLGSHIEGSFTCRAPKGDCAPSHVIDAKATDELSREQAPWLEAARLRAGVAASDASRTAERTIRIVFPAHVDEAGVLHDEAVAWAVVERPQWAGTLRVQDHGQGSSMRAMRRKLRQAQNGRDEANDPAAANPTSRPADLAAETATGSEMSQPADLDEAARLPVELVPGQEGSLFQLASPLPLPSPVAEATSGAPALDAGGSGSTSSSQDRIPRHLHDAPRFPAAEVIEAAKAKSAKAKRERGALSSSRAPLSNEAAPLAVQPDPETK
jgi:conjugal transfer pilus assembly protein TraV